MDEQDEEASVQHLLSLLPAPDVFRWAPSDRFDPRGATDRIGLLALASLRPVSFDGLSEIDLAGMLDEHGSNALLPLDPTETTVKGSIAGRIMHPPLRGLRSMLQEIPTRGSWPGLLESHALDGPTLEHLLAGHFDEFLQLRERRIRRIAERLVQRQCRWGYGDRPSISRYLHEASE